MASERKKTCAKCGISSMEDSAVTFHRFPLPSRSTNGSLKAKIWAKYCFPNDDWSSEKSLYDMYKSGKYLCGMHFDASAFISDEKTKLNKFAIPYEAKNILAQEREQINDNQTLNVQQSINQPRTSQCSSPEFSTELSPPMLDVIQKPGKGILEERGIKSLAEVTPRKQKMYKRCRKKLSEILRLRKKFKATKKCNRNILKALHEDEAVREILKSNLSSPFYRLLQSQLRNTKKKMAGRKLTVNDKVLALSLYKKSRSCYRLLKRLFCLPNACKLKSLLNKIPFSCGINQEIVETIKEITQKRPIHDNLCILAFDEMSIRTHLSYNETSDQINGYLDHAGRGITKEIESKAITFMAIGLRKKWKQPIAYYFSDANLKVNRLSLNIKEVLDACFKAGLEVVGTVCGYDGVNIRAMNALGSSTDQPYFTYKGHEIVTIFDPPQLLKCFRNNFIKYKIHFVQEINGKTSLGVAKWSHIEDFYNMDQSNPNFVFAPALTKQHLNPNEKQKMKTQMAAQVLSHSVAAGLYAKVAQNELPQEFTATANVVANMDQLFDAVNGDTSHRNRGKPLLTNISSTSPHIECFSKMKTFFNEMRFVGARAKPLPQEGWLRTINAIERLYKYLKTTYSLNALSPKRLNLDPLENCFGCVRSNCGSNPKPTSTQFVAAFKTSILTNLININKSKNCENDENELLNNFKIFLSKRDRKNRS